MNKTLNRLIKVSTSLLTVATIILAGCIVPAYAADGIYLPSENYYRQVIDGDNRTIYYNFPVEAYMLLSDDDELVYSGNTNVLDYVPDVSSQKLSLVYFPLGVRRNAGQTMTSGVVDVSDFQSQAVLSLKAGFLFDCQYAYQSAAYGDSKCYFYTVWRLLCYDDQGNFIDQIISTQQETTVVLPELAADVTSSSYTIPLESSQEFTLPTGTKYILPRVACDFKLPGQEQSHVITRYTVTNDSFRLVAQYNMLIEQSETMKAIDDHIEELISGSDADQAAGEAMKDQAGQMQDDMNAALDEMEQLPQADSGNVSMEGMVTEPIPEANIDLSFDNLVTGDDYKTYNNFFTTLAANGLWVKMMIIVCSMIWVSTLLYGRRG